MLKGEPVDEAELINQPPRENPDLLTQKHIIEAENPELSQGVNPYEGVDIQQVPNTKIVNDIRFPGTSVLNQGNSISNNQNNINDLDPNLSPMPYDINNKFQKIMSPKTKKFLIFTEKKQLYVGIAYQY